MSRFRNRPGNPAVTRRPAAGMIILALALTLILPQAALAAYWKLTGDLNMARAYHTATLLLDGRILVAGGRGAGGVLDSAEVYDPATGKWTLTAPMSTPRVKHTATRMKDGRVLMVGGDSGSQILSSAELFDPAAMAFVPAPSVGNPRYRHVAVLMKTGDVLIAGGSDGAAALPNNGPVPAVEKSNHWNAKLYSPSGDQIIVKPGGTMQFPQLDGTVYLDQYGVPHVGGGTDVNTILNKVQGYNWDSNSWFNADPFNTASIKPNIFLGPNKDLYKYGGYTNQGYTTDGEFYYWNGSDWVPGPSEPRPARGDAGAAQLGTIIVEFGGVDFIDQPLDSTVIYNWEMKSWGFGPNYLLAVSGHSATTSGNRIVGAGGKKADGLFTTTTGVFVQNADMTGPIMPITLE